MAEAIEIQDLNIEDPQDEVKEFKAIPGKFGYQVEGSDEEETNYSSDGESYSAEEEGSDPELDETDIQDLYPVLSKMIDPESGMIHYNRLWDVPGHLGNMIVVGKGRKLEDRALDENGLEPTLWLIGPDCKIRL
jgi:hypothetical protein